MSKSNTNAYGVLNPLYPTYDDKSVEMEDLMRFFKFAYCKDNGFQGTGVFEITDDDETFYLEIEMDQINGASGKVLKSEPLHYDFYVSCPYNTFHDVFWGYTTARTLVMGGGCRVKNWAYRAVLNFGLSFDMTTDSWERFYKSGISIKPMLIEYDHQIKLYDYKNIGAALPISANESDFMYQWIPNKIENKLENNDIETEFDNRFGFKGLLYNKLNLWMYHNQYYNKIKRYQNNICHPILFTKNLTQKYINKIKDKSNMLMSHAMDYDLMMNMY